MPEATATLPSPSGPGVGAAGLQVAGMTPMSTVDWPGMLAATVFLQGCPWDCGYCHNSDLIAPRTPGRLPWSDVTSFLRRRRGLLDAVVFSGGEATRQGALGPAVEEVRELGFAVGLHTAGPYPRRLERVLPQVDWVGLDLKALPEDYPEVVGRVGSGAAAWQCLELVLASGVDHEVRTTVHPGSAAARGAVEIARRAKAAGVAAFALQQARDTGTREGFVARAAGWDQECAELADRIAELGFAEFTFRAA